MKTIITGGVGIAVLAGGAYMLFLKQGGEEIPSPDQSVLHEEERTIPRIEWESHILSEDAFGMPESAVSVSVDGERIDLGTAAGSCAASSLPPLAAQISSYLCWWAGAGTEFAVFYEDGTVVIKKGIVEEGGADYEGFRGDFETLKTFSQ